MRIDDLIVKTKSRGVDRESDTLNENRHRHRGDVEGGRPLAASTLSKATVLRGDANLGEN